MKTINLSTFLLISTLLTACGHAGVTDTTATAGNSEGSDGSQTGVQSNGTTVRATASSLPDTVIVTAKFKEEPVPIIMEDHDGSTVAALMANIVQTVYSAPIHDFLDLSKSSSHEFVSPNLNGCRLTTYMFDTVGPANEIFNFGGRDARGSKACQSFMTDIGKNGLQMQFTDVPLLNGNGLTIKTVKISITNP